MSVDLHTITGVIGAVGFVAFVFGLAAKRVQGAVTKTADLIVSAAGDYRRVRQALSPPPKRIRSRKTGEGGDG